MNLLHSSNVHQGVISAAALLVVLSTRHDFHDRSLAGLAYSTARLSVK